MGKKTWFCVLLISACAAARPARADIYFFKDKAGVIHFTNVPTDRRYKVLLEEASNRFRGRAPRRSEVNWASNLSFPMPRAELSALIEETAHRYDVDPALVHAVVRAESGFDHLAVSPAGARGLMQLMPGTALEVGVRNAFHPGENLDGGVYYLRSMIDRFNGDLRLALAAYNAGPGAVESYGGVPPYPETLDYVERVFRFRQQFLHTQMEQRRLALASAAGR